MAKKKQATEAEVITVNGMDIQTGPTLEKIEPHEDWYDEGFTREQWDNQDPEDQHAMIYDWDGPKAMEIRKQLRAMKDQATVPPSDNQLTVSSSRESALSIVGGVTTEELKQALVIQTEQRKLIQQFIKDNLVDDIDFGRIHVVKNCPLEDKKRGSCDRDYHYSKSILFKPGQEKIFSLFSITDELLKDEEAYVMLGNLSGLVAYKCVMYRGDKKIGEGRGAAMLGATQNDPNATIKKAEKRARMDACLSLGFSAYFTQDLDDPEYKSQREMMNSKAAAEAERRDKDDLGLLIRDIGLPIDNAERTKLFRMMKDVGYEQREAMLDLLTANGIAAPDAMTSGQARGFMRKLRDGTYTPVAVRAVPVAPPEPPDDVITDIDQLDVANSLDEGEAAMHNEPVYVADAELVVDDDLKKYVVEELTKLGLNNRGEMWFKKKVSGKPFGSITDFNDGQWRSAYDLIVAIQDQNIEVDDSYIAGLIESEDDKNKVVRDPSEPYNGKPDFIDQAWPGNERTDLSDKKGTQEDV
jgi:hypothetical protein